MQVRKSVKYSLCAQTHYFSIYFCFRAVEIYFFCTFLFIFLNDASFPQCKKGTKFPLLCTKIDGEYDHDFHRLRQPRSPRRNMQSREGDFSILQDRESSLSISLTSLGGSDRPHPCYMYTHMLMPVSRENQHQVGRNCLREGASPLSVIRTAVIHNGDGD